MAEPTSLWPVIVGGVIALGGVVITSGITVALKFVESRNERKKRRAEKFEELVELIYRHDHWQDQKRNIYVSGGEGTVELSPIAKIEAITAVYFPQFSELMREVVLASQAYELWMMKAGQKRPAKEPDVTEGFREAYAPVGEKRGHLLDALKKFAREEFQ